MEKKTRAELRRECCFLRVKRMTREELESKSLIFADREIAHLEVEDLERLLRLEKAKK